MKSFFIKVAAVLLISLMFFSFALYEKNKIETLTDFTPVEVKKMMPSLSLKTINSRELNSESLKGNPTLVHFWGTWCPPCKEELPAFINFLKKMPKNIQIVMIAANDTQKKIVKFLSRYDSLPERTFIVADSHSHIMNLFGTYQVPETFFYGKDLSLKKKYIGPQNWNNPTYLQDIQ